MEEEHSPKRRRRLSPRADSAAPASTRAQAAAAPGDISGGRGPVPARPGPGPGTVPDPGTDPDPGTSTRRTSPGAMQPQHPHRFAAAASRSPSITSITSADAGVPVDASQALIVEEVPAQGPAVGALNQLQHLQENVTSPFSRVVANTSPGSTKSIERLRDPRYPTTAWRPPARLDPRPLPPPAPEGDDDLTSIRLALGRNAPWLPSLGLLAPPQPEPELPPSIPDIVSSTPPRGIHSSPSSRWRSSSRSKSKSKGKGRSKAKKSSPLKPPNMSRPNDLKAELSLRGVAPQNGPQKDNAPPSFPLDERSHPARQVPARDADAEKKGERDALRDEIARLRRDLQIVSKENEHIRLMQSSGRVISSQDEHAVMDVIQRHMIDAENPAVPPVSQQLAKVALGATGLGLLPFCRPAPLVVAPQEQQQQQDYSDIKSHRPVPMTAEEELPFLQLFSPFTVTSTIAVLPQLPNQPVRQRRVMTLRSKDGLGLFTAKLEMVVDATDLNILDLKVLALEPAARAELTPFADKICRGDCNRSMQRNVGILSWAMGDWYRVSLRRARLWAQLDRELAVTKGGLFQATAEMRKRKKRRRRDDDSDAEGEEPAPKAATSDTATVRHYLGQQFFDLSIPPWDASEPSSPSSHSSLRLEWKIEFDWTGEAQSKVACFIGVPGKWRVADQRGVLGKLPHLFHTLVEGGQDLSTATKTIAALLVGDRGDRTD